MSENKIKVIAISGSLREKGQTNQALKIALEGAAELGADTNLIRLNDYNLPFCAGKDHEMEITEGVIRLREEVKAVHGVLIGTPEYHGSFSGVLKNALDFMSFDQFSGKLVGLIGVAGGSLGAINALNSLRTIGRSLHAWVVPEQASIPNSSQAFDNAGKPVDAKIELRLKSVGRQVARFAYLHLSEETNEFLKAWENAPANPGGV